MGGRRSNKKNMAALSIIVQYKRQHDGNSPSYMELKELLGLSSTSAVNFRIKSMVKDNLIDVSGHRHIIVIGGYQNYGSE
jgi:hypothetical protein